MKRFETAMESVLFRSRWLLAPFFFGLIVAIIALLVKFGKELLSLVTGLLGMNGSELIVSILTLVDSALIASLLLIIAFSGYENFVSRIGVGEHEDRPAWMGKVGFADLKIKVMGAIVAISAVELLKGFINVEEFTNQELAWKVGIHVTFVVSGVLFAITDRIAEGKGGGH
ncbi:MAG: TIGR00645 family protein [Burkholderiaceae bacterium]|nr:TIGR00645 family protein [Burkholderiaceae bacterium]